MRLTQTQLAKQLGISQRSVSVAFGGAGRISDETRQRILSRAREVGYRPNRLASSLRRGRSGSVGVVWAFVNPWSGDSEIGMGLLERLQNRGLATYQVQYTVNRKLPLLRQRLAELVDRQVDAIVMQGVPDELTDPEVLRCVRNTPVVAVCREDLPDFPGDLVIHDRFHAIDQVVDHLVASGRRRLAMAISLHEESNPGKYEAFLRRCEHHGLVSHPHPLIPLERPDNHRLTGERHELGMKQCFPDEVPLDAIFAFNDIGAMHIIRDLKRRGLRVPDDIAVVGFNNTEAGPVWDPPLASGDRAFAQTIATTDRLLAQRLGDPDLPPQRETVPMAFVWRESAGPRIGESPTPKASI